MATTLNVSPFCCFSVGQLSVPQCLGLSLESGINLNLNTKFLPYLRCPSYIWACKVKNDLRETGPFLSVSYGHLIKCCDDDVPAVVRDAVPDAVKQEYESRKAPLQFFILLDGQHRNTALR